MICSTPRRLMSSTPSPSWPIKKQHLVPKSGTYPLGFLAAGVFSGVKKNGNNDIAIVISPKFPCKAAAVFTTNKFCAAPVMISKEILDLEGDSSPPLFGLLVNSGCANACTGEQGMFDATEMSKLLTQDSVKKLPSLVMSTGVIGQKLQMQKIKAGVKEALKVAGSDHQSWMSATQGIMTTDTFPKLISREFANGATGEKYRMAGFSKGAGMIHPNMATMLSSIFIDCDISKKMLTDSVRHAADRSFNAISVDGDTSTNDTFTVFANGASKAKITATTFPEFEKNLTAFATELAQLIVRDGEGATKFVEVKVTGAATLSDAKQVANTIVKSPLVKTAIYGKDANWGRIICAVGYSGVDIIPSKVNLHFGTIDQSKTLHLFKDGEPNEINEDIATEILETEDILIHVDLGMGKEHLSIFTCDLSHEYVSINGDYRS